MAQQKRWKQPHAHRGYPSDVGDEEWALVVPYLTLMTEQAPQREYALRDVFNALLDARRCLRVDRPRPAHDPATGR